MEDNLFVLFPVWENTFPLMKLHILFLKNPCHLFHLMLVPKIKEKSALWVDKVVGELFWNEN